MTQVINLFGGACTGKSTLSAEIFVQMKKYQLNCELVQEWVKTWAYEKRSMGSFDQFYIAGKQIRKESFLYDKVDFVITDCPLWLGAIYESHYEGTHYIEKHIAGFVEFAQSRGIKYHNFLLKRSFKYNPIGRFQDEKEAIEIDKLMKEFLTRLELPYTVVDVEPEYRASFIINSVYYT